MAKNAATHSPPAPSSASQPADSRLALAPVIEINVRHIGRTPQPEKLTGSEAPEGWIKRIDRPREGKVWVGFFHLYVADPSGTAVRRKKEKTLGPATMPKHEAQQKLADYIEEYTGSTRLFHDAVAKHVARVVVVNTNQFKVIRQSVKKTDPNDARTLAMYLSKNMLPEVA